MLLLHGKNFGGAAGFEDFGVFTDFDNTFDVCYHFQQRDVRLFFEFLESSSAKLSMFRVAKARDPNHTA